jgi:hypothetical protein
MTPIAVMFFKAVEFGPSVRERRPSTQPLTSRRLCDCNLFRRPLACAKSFPQRDRSTLAAGRLVRTPARTQQTGYEKARS